MQFGVGSTVGNGETVVNAGMSVKLVLTVMYLVLDVAIGKEVLELKKTVAVQNAQIQKLTALLNGLARTNMKADRSTLFPDVPNNHWAYEAVSDLSRRGLVEGYPDGTFGGDRMLTVMNLLKLCTELFKTALLSMIDSYLNLVLKWRYSVWIQSPRIMKDNQLLNV